MNIYKRDAAWCVACMALCVMWVKDIKKNRDANLFQQGAISHSADASNEMYGVSKNIPSDQKREQESSPEISDEFKKNIYETGLRMSRGEYVLKSEDPNAVKLHRQGIDDETRVVGGEVAARLENDLISLGVPSKIIHSLTNHAQKIVKASMEAEISEINIKAAKLDYDRRIKSVLSEDQYRKYRDLENVKSVERFLEVSLSGHDGYEPEKIARALGSLEIDMPRASRLPYDPDPKVEFGGGENVDRLRKRIDNLGVSIELIGKLGTDGAIPESVANQVQQTLRNSVRETTALIKLLKNSDFAGGDAPILGRQK